MNPIEQLREILVGRYPNLKFSIDLPALDPGHWFLDVSSADGVLVVAEWKEGHGVGVSFAHDILYGTGPDAVFADVDSAAGHVTELLKDFGIEV